MPNIGDIVSRNMREARYALRQYGDAKEHLERYRRYVNANDWARADYYGQELEADGGSLYRNCGVPQSVADKLIDLGQTCKLHARGENKDCALDYADKYKALLDSGDVVCEIVKFIRRPTVKAVRNRSS